MIFIFFIVHTVRQLKLFWNDIFFLHNVESGLLGKGH